MDQRFEDIVTYHDRTKHRYERYALGPPFMDWSNQPNPFRFFTGSKLNRLPFTLEKQMSYEKVFTCEAFETQVLDKQTLGFIFELSMGLSGWKTLESNSWALRMNPSSGNLHPCEVYVIGDFLEEEKGLELFHYTPFWHGLESIGDIKSSLFAEFKDKAYLLLSSIYWREAWKYGERAFRYCQLDMGHSIAALSISSKLMGYDLRRDDNFVQSKAEELLDFKQSTRHNLEREDMELGAWLAPSKDKKKNDIEALDSIEISALHLEVNQLSKEHRKWSAIEFVADASKATTKITKTSYEVDPNVDKISSKTNILDMIRQRRSAVSYDGVTSISYDEFKCMLSHTIYQKDAAPFSFFDGAPRVHFFIFVHRVVGLESGLYLFLRNENHLNELKESMSSDFLWKQPNDCKIPLYLLKQGDYKLQAESISCGQSIASDSAFSLGMLTRFESEIEMYPQVYKELYWECGAMGQLLYLEAEKHGVRATGIGCFFDDECHRLAGIKDKSFQSLYHFTIGGPVEDDRFTTLTPYHHLSNAAYLK